MPTSNKTYLILTKSVVMKVLNKLVTCFKFLLSYWTLNRNV